MEYNITRKRIDRCTFVIDGTVAFTDLTGYEVNFLYKITVKTLIYAERLEKVCLPL